ncbi:tetratricopeptide repeat protein [Vibrio cholerae]|uniref:tetratricopeptide repeat protein n=1 Tax=Vibrio cholerae TaxID=666 RepID=UPI001372F7F5|nr:tetratricopeptide repeat protein [Vibrio cholerae]NAO57910.1 tetratricopeptide repeat protein [Vibrio cholerae]
MHSPDFEAIWAELKLTLEWHHDFSLFFVFVADTKASLALKQRLDDYMRSHSKALRRINPHKVEDLPKNVINRIFHENTNSSSAIWLDLTEQDNDGIWDEFRAKTLATLNKRRSQLEKTIKSPLFIELPFACAAHLVTWAPDLWSVRQQTIELPAQFLLNNTQSVFDDNAYEQDSILSCAQLEDALSQARDLVEQRKQGRSAQEKRQYSIALGRLGDLLCEVNQYAEAKTAYAQSLAIFQQLLTSLGDSPQVLRDLSVSFNKLGYIEQRLGDLHAAKASYSQSLAIRQQLHTSFGDSPPVLRGLSVSLSNLGEIEQQLGDLHAAKAAYTQSLAIDQQLHTSLGDSPHVLRDLSVSFNKLGDIEQQLGDLHAAKAAYAQSLAIFQQLHSTLGDSPPVLRDLIISLRDVANIERLLGRDTAATQTETELSLIQCLLAKVSDSTEA